MTTLGGPAGNTVSRDFAPRNNEPAAQAPDDSAPTFADALRQQEEKSSPSRPIPVNVRSDAKNKISPGSIASDQKSTPGEQPALDLKLPGGGSSPETDGAVVAPAATPVAASVFTSKESPETGAPALPAPVTNLSAVLAQAAIMSAGLRQNAAPSSSMAVVVAPGNKMPFSTVSKSPGNTPAKEKKSAAIFAEGSFIQLPGATPSTASAIGMGLVDPVSAGAYSPAGQQPTPVEYSWNFSPRGSIGDALSLAGMANGEKESMTNGLFNLGEIFAGQGITVPAGANAMPADSFGGTNIATNGNHEFAAALKQVMDVARMTAETPGRLPLRVAIEIQTPPGAIVNVFVSRQNDQWRAQLSTNDPQALAWVQDQVAALRQSSDAGTDVRWLPPQMEGNTAFNYSRDGGGQNQPRQETPERRKKATASTDTISFMTTIHSKIAGAA
jgi:hypothetical protein